MRRQILRVIRPLVVGLLVGAVAFACDRSPTGVPAASLLASRSKTTKTGLVACSQSYDSVTRVIGPKGGHLQVGAHFLLVDSLALSSPVRITAVAPQGPVRWVRFQPDGLVFNATADGWSATVWTSYAGCGVSPDDTLHIVQVSDSLGIIAHLQSYRKSNKNPWGQGTKYASGRLQHFSNYAIAW